MTATIAFGSFATDRFGAMPMQATTPLPPLCLVSLIDRRTRAALRINGRLLSVFTRDPEGTVADLLADRDPALWEARIEALEPGGKR